MTLNQLPNLITRALILLAIYEIVVWLNKHGLLDHTPGPRPKPHASGAPPRRRQGLPATVALVGRRVLH